MKTLALASLLILAQGQAAKIDTKDWKTFTGKTKAFSIRAPKDWTSSDPNDPDHQKAVEYIKKNNPDLAKMMENGNKDDDLAIVEVPAAGMPSINNVNEKLLPGIAITESLYDQVFEGLVAQAKLKQAGHKTVQLPAGKALSYWGVLTISLGENQSMDLKMLGYMLTKDNNTYIVTMTTSPDDTKQKAIYEEMARTIAIKG